MDPYFASNYVLPTVQLVFLLCIGSHIGLNVYIAVSFYKNGCIVFAATSLLLTALQTKLNSVFLMAIRKPFRIEATPALYHPGWSLICYIPFGFPLLIMYLQRRAFWSALAVELLSYLMFPVVYLLLIVDHLHLWARNLHAREDLYESTYLLVMKIVVIFYESIPQVILQSVAVTMNRGPGFVQWIASLCLGGCSLFFFAVTIQRDFVQWIQAKQTGCGEDYQIELINISDKSKKASRRRSSSFRRSPEKNPIDGVETLRRESLAIKFGEKPSRGIKTTKNIEYAQRNVGAI